MIRGPVSVGGSFDFISDRVTVSSKGCGGVHQAPPLSHSSNSADESYLLYIGFRPGPEPGAVKQKPAASILDMAGGQRKHPVRGEISSITSPPHYLLPRPDWWRHNLERNQIH
jgi:hypothetical protein